MSRYLVGCAGQFVLYNDGSGRLTGTTDDEDEAIVMCLTGPVGCEVYDTHTDKWIGPTCMEEIEAAQDRLASREERHGDS